jgi:hypothetical protein
MASIITEGVKARKQPTILHSVTINSSAPSKVALQGICYVAVGEHADVSLANMSTEDGRDRMVC